MPAINEGLTPRNIEEKYAKCHLCAADLSYIEHVMNGNRCIFCESKHYSPPLWTWLFNAYLDWSIHNELARWKDKKEICPDCNGAGKYRASTQEDINDMIICPSCEGKGDINVGRTKFIGYLGGLGYESIAAMPPTAKRELLKAIRKAVI